MNSKTVSTDAVITGTLWAVVAMIFVAAWALYLAGDAGLAVMVALTGCPLVAIAIVAQVRCYTGRVCGLVRATRLEGSDAGVRSLR